MYTLIYRCAYIIILFSFLLFLSLLIGVQLGPQRSAREIPAALTILNITITVIIMLSVVIIIITIIIIARKLILIH